MKKIILVIMIAVSMLMVGFASCQTKKQRDSSTSSSLSQGITGSSEISSEISSEETSNSGSSSSVNDTSLNSSNTSNTYGSLTIADVNVGHNKTATINPIFSSAEGQYETTYTYDTTKISIIGNIVTGLEDNAVVVVTATTAYHQTQFTVTVSEVYVTEISISGQKTWFENGEAFSKGGLVVKAIMSDNSTRILEEGEYQVDSSKYNQEVAGIYNIVVSALGFSKNYNVMVEEICVEGIAISGYTISFNNGTEFSTGNLIVEAKMSNGTTRVLEESEYVVDSSTYQKYVGGKYSISVTALGFTESYEVMVSSSFVTDITISGYTTSFKNGEEFSTGSLVVKANMSDTTTKTLTTNEYIVDSSKYQQNIAGTYTIPVTAFGFTKTYNVTVGSVFVKDITISGYTTSFKNGTAFSTGNLVVKANYSNATTKTLTKSEYTVNSSSYKQYVEGTYAITVSALGLTKSYNVTVGSVFVTSLSISGYTTSFKNGTAFSTGNLVVKANYSNATSKTITTSEYTVNSSNYKQYVEGTYTITISALGLTKTYKVTVGSVFVKSITVSGGKISFNYGESFSTGNLVVNATMSNNTSKKLTTSEYTVNSSSYKSTTAGNYTITVTSGSASATYSVTVLPNRGTLTIANVSVEYQGDATIKPVFSTTGGQSAITYTYDTSKIAISGNVVTGKVPGAKVTVTAKSSYHTVTFTVNVGTQVSYIDASDKSLTDEEQAQVDKLLYKNTLTNKIRMADPSVLYCKEDGYYYMYGTCDTTRTGPYGIRCMRSKNLTDWETAGFYTQKINGDTYGFAFLQPDANVLNYSHMSKYMTESEFTKWQSNTWIKNGNIWAPSVIYDETLGKYLMFSSAQTSAAGVTPVDYTLFLAVSDSPAGPFIQWTGTIKGGTYQNGKTFASRSVGYGDYFMNFDSVIDTAGNVYTNMCAIDPEPFIDPVTGDKYMFFVGLRAYKSTNSIFGMKMLDWFTPDYSTLTLLAKPGFKTVLDTEETLSGEGAINEGPAVVYNPNNKYYYLTYSANRHLNKEYCVKQAISTSPLGVYIKIDNDKGGRILSSEEDWLHRSGTAHHTFINVGSETFIVYPMHEKVPLTTTYDWTYRIIGIDKVVWVKNPDGLLVMNTNGPSFDYRLRPNSLTGYKNVASSAKVSCNQSVSGTSLGYLTDGTAAILDNEGIKDFEANKKQLVLTFDFNTAITLKGIIVTNSSDILKAFGKISKIEIDFAIGGNSYKVNTGEVSFDWDTYYRNNANSGVGKLIPGCGSIAIFDEITNVKSIKIYIEPQIRTSVTGLNVAEVAIIGK